MNRVRIVNIGQVGHMTQVTDAETGEPIECVHHIDISLDVQGMPRATIWTYMPEVDVTVDATIKQVCPCCGCERSARA